MHLSLPKRSLLFILASVCQSLQCLISALTQGGDGGHFLRFSCSVLLWGGRGPADTSLASVGGARSVGATLGLPRSQRVCFPVCTTQAPGCSAGNCLRRALGSVHFPGLSRSGSGSRALHKPQTRLGLRFVLFPGPSSSGDQVLCERTLPEWRVRLITFRSQPLGSTVSDLWLRPS